MQPYPQIRNSLPTNVQRVFLGVNKQDPFSIKDNQASDMQNISCDNTQFPILTARPGYTLVGAALAARILGLFPWENTELNTISNGAWYSLIAGTWTSRATGFDAAANWSFANFKGGFANVNLIGANGVDAIQAYTGSAVAALSGAPTSGNYIETYHDRLWCAVGNVLNSSEYRVATNWTTTTGADTDPFSDTIETGNGEDITAIKAGIGHLTIFQPNALYELFGYGSSDFSIRSVTFDQGAINNQCVTTVNGIQYFLHTTGIYEYAGGILPSRNFSLPIQDYIDRINPAQINKCSMGTDKKRLYISIPLDTATDPDTILEFIPEFGIWNIWSGHSALHISNINNTLYMGDVSGEIRKIGGTTDNGTAISANWVSKPFGGQSYSQRIRWKRAWIVADVPTGATLIIYLSKLDTGNTDWTLVQAITADNVLESTRVIIPTTAVLNANWIRVKFDISGPVQIKEFSWDEEPLPIY